MFLSLNVAIYVAFAGLVTYLAVRFILRRDTATENKRRAAIDLAQTLKGYGLKHIPAFLVDYGVGDYSGMLHKIGLTQQLFAAGPEVVLKEFDGVFANVLARKLATNEGRAYLTAQLATTAASSQPT